MQATFRPGIHEDAQACGTVFYDAFRLIAEQHNFPVDFPQPETAVSLLMMLLSREDVYSVVAEMERGIVGSNFLWEGDVIAGVGPITVDSSVQNGSIGRQLMERVMDRALAKQFAGVRLVQAAYHNRSLSLYSKLGFDAREPLSVMQGPQLGLQLPGYLVRPATAGDLDACNRLCRQVHGHDRKRELFEATKQGSALVVDHGGAVTGYATLIGFFGHAVGRTNEELKALIGAATSFQNPGFLLPTRNGELLRWCLEHGLRIVYPMTLMSHGLYQQPSGSFLPSILY
ncbi:MAG TPA: GNAT family N-acetyltransferase [Nitrospira sp.]|jgi:predicted N-acetyltransferase YhbS|nr:GNAT family N-acetyltransferase [Nitrospira sp.]